MFFFLLQTEQGDLFKVTLESEEDVVSDWLARWARGVGRNCHLLPLVSGDGD